MEKKKHLLALNHNLFFSDGGVTKPRILFQNVTRKTSRPDYPLGDFKKIKIKKNFKKNPTLKLVAITLSQRSYKYWHCKLILSLATGMNDFLID